MCDYFEAFQLPLLLAFFFTPSRTHPHNSSSSLFLALISPPLKRFFPLLRLCSPSTCTTQAFLLPLLWPFASSYSRLFIRLGREGKARGKKGEKLELERRERERRILLDKLALNRENYKLADKSNSNHLCLLRRVFTGKFTSD